MVPKLWWFFYMRAITELPNFCIFTEQLLHVGKNAITQRQHISYSCNNPKAAYLAVSIKPLVAAGVVWLSIATQ